MCETPVTPMLTATATREIRGDMPGKRQKKDESMEGRRDVDEVEVEDVEDGEDGDQAGADLNNFYEIEIDPVVMEFHEAIEEVRGSQLSGDAVQQLMQSAQLPLSCRLTFEAPPPRNLPIPRLMCFALDDISCDSKWVWDPSEGHGREAARNGRFSEFQVLLREDSLRLFVTAILQPFSGTNR